MRTFSIALHHWITDKWGDFFNWGLLVGITDLFSHRLLHKEIYTRQYLKQLYQSQLFTFIIRYSTKNSFPNWDEIWKFEIFKKQLDKRLLDFTSISSPQFLLKYHNVQKKQSLITHFVSLSVKYPGLTFLVFSGDCILIDSLLLLTHFLIWILQSIFFPFFGLDSVHHKSSW